MIGIVPPSRNPKPKTRRKGQPLSPREKEVFDLVANGHTNRQGAKVLGISPRTFEVHRANLMRKLGAKNVAELVRNHVAQEATKPDQALPGNQDGWFLY